MTSRSHRPLFAGLRIMTAGTLLSRLLGLVRDVATAALFGLAQGGIMDAFVVAFRVPNLFRRLFGEGALAASYLPVLSGRLERDRRSAWQLASVILVGLAMVLLAILVAAEAVCAIIRWGWGDVPGVPLVVSLTATLLPYMVLICLTAQLAATLHALGHFTMPALAPVVLNVCWLLAVGVAAEWFGEDKVAQAYVLAGGVLFGGVVQLAMQWPPLVRRGFRYDSNWSATRDDVRRVVRAMLPMMFGLAVTQINTLLDVLIAWGLAAAPDGSQTVAWLGDVAYPMRQGAAAAVYYGERMYQFPMGLIGVSVATVIFPLLARHATRGLHDRIGHDLTAGLRLVLLLALPACVGLVMLAEPIARLLFQHGQFTPGDAQRTAGMIAGYGLGVWAYCALPVMVRGYYALGMQTTPVAVAAAAVALNLLLNLTLIWPLAEQGLAVSTAISAAVQVVVLAMLFSRHGSPLLGRSLAGTVAVAGAACTAMALTLWVAIGRMPAGGDMTSRLVAACVPLCIGGAVYLVILRLVGPAQFVLLTGRVPTDEQADEQVEKQTRDR